MNVGYLLIFVGSFEMIVIFVRIITETKIYIKKIFSNPHDDFFIIAVRYRHLAADVEKFNSGIPNQPRLIITIGLDIIFIFRTVCVCVCVE